MSGFPVAFGGVSQSSGRRTSSESSPTGDKLKETLSAVEQRFRDLIRHPDSVISERFPAIPYNTSLEQARATLAPDTPLQHPDSRQNPPLGQRDPERSATSGDPNTAPAHLRNLENSTTISPDTPINQNATHATDAGPSSRQPGAGPLQQASLSTQGDGANDPPPGPRILHPPKQPSYAFGPQMFNIPLPPVKPEYLAAIYRPVRITSSTPLGREVTIYYTDHM